MWCGMIRMYYVRNGQRVVTTNDHASTRPQNAVTFHCDEIWRKGTLRRMESIHDGFSFTVQYSTIVPNRQPSQPSCRMILRSMRLLRLPWWGLSVTGHQVGDNVSVTAAGVWSPTDYAPSSLLKFLMLSTFRSITIG
jgi:hypothetical protein